MVDKINFWLPGIRVFFLIKCHLRSYWKTELFLKFVLKLYGILDVQEIVVS